MKRLCGALAALVLTVGAGCDPASTSDGPLLVANAHAWSYELDEMDGQRYEAEIPAELVICPPDTRCAFGENIGSSEAG